MAVSVAYGSPRVQHPIVGHVVSGAEMRCPKCTTDNPEGAKFCMHCAAPAAPVSPLEAYAEDVRSGRFPEPKHSYTMVDGELPKLQEAIDL